MSESDVSWTKNVFGQDPLILGDENMLMQEDDEEQTGYVGHSHEDKEVTAHQNMNVDYRKKKTMKRNTHVTIGYNEALIT